MFWKRKEGELNPAPRKLPGLVSRYLIEKQNKKADWINSLNAVIRPNGENTLDIRIFDPTEALIKEVEVKDYATLDAHPELIFFEGKYSEQLKTVELKQKKELSVSQDIKLFTKEEIQQKIEQLTVPGSSVFFYLAGSPACGGPLGRGAAVVELNPNQDKKQKKYIISVANVDGMEPVGKKQEIYRSDKAKEITSWVKEKHYKREERL